jgi:cystathionine beta-lyase family protein involved in aluminum resistance
MLPVSHDKPIDPRNKVQLQNAEQFYAVTDEQGKSIDYDQADGRQLFNHYRHNMTNYDRVLDELRQEQAGRVSGYQQKQATAGAAEQILEKYRDEHAKVIHDSRKKGQMLKSLMQKAGVGTVSALANVLDSCSDTLKNLAHLENSQRSLQNWNDTYRVQRELVKQVLDEAKVEAEVRKQINTIYSTKSVGKAIDAGSNLLDWEKSEIIKLVKTVVRYSKL